MWFEYLDSAYNLDTCILYKNFQNEIHLVFGQNVTLLINKQEHKELVQTIQRAIKLRKI